MRRILLAAVPVLLALPASAAPAGAAPQLAPTVRAEAYSVAWEPRPGIYAISVTCDAIASSGAVATAVQCVLSTGDAGSRALPGLAAATTLTVLTAEHPVTVCATGSALFLDGELVTSAPYCAPVVPD